MQGSAEDRPGPGPRERASMPDFGCLDVQPDADAPGRVRHCFRLSPRPAGKPNRLPDRHGLPQPIRVSPGKTRPGPWKKGILSMKRTCLAGVLPATLLLSAGFPERADSSAELNVVVSLKPVHSLVAGVIGDLGTPKLLITGSGDPHTFRMRPSEARMLSEADVVVWVGETMETFLIRPIANLGSGTTVVTLSHAEGMDLLPFREAGIWEDEGEHEHDHAHEDQHEDEPAHGDEAHDHGEFDTHIWIDPELAGVIVDVVADAFVRLDPQNADYYMQNAQEIQGRILAKAIDVQDRLRPVHEKAFIVFHDGYRYFEDAYGLNGVGAVVIDPGRPPGARRLLEMREAMHDRNVECAFAEAQYDPGLIETVIRGADIRTGSLDALGIDIEPGPDAWFELMDDLAKSFTDCLGTE